MKLELCQQIFEKYSNLKSHEYPFSGTQVVQCGREGGQEGRHAGRQAHRRTDMTKLIIASRNLADAPIKEHGQYISTVSLTYIRTYTHTDIQKTAYVFISA